MLLTERHIIKKSDPQFTEADKLCFLSKNLYNAGLYQVRQHFFEHKTFQNFVQSNEVFVKSNNPDYRALPAKVSQQTLKIVEQNFKSFFGLLKAKKSETYTKKVKIPNYLSNEGKFVVTYTDQAFSKVLLKKGILNPSKTKLKIKTDKQNIRQFRLIPKGNHIVAEVIYEVAEEVLKEDNGKYASIDLGLNNLATVVSNVSKPFIINGKPLKSINHFYNKSKAKLQSILGDKKTSKKIQQLGYKRNNKITDYLHKASRFIINHLVSEGINTLIVGYNKEWKQEINIGSKNNQNFVQIPFTKLLQMLEYKCKLSGILFKKQEESYTSKCSFFDNEVVKKHELYAGKRVKRGLFKTGNNLMVNADVNGSLNIMKKAVGEVDFRYPIQVCSTPSKVKTAGLYPAKTLTKTNIVFI